MLLPAQIELDWSWQSLVNAAAGEWLWLEHLSNLLYVLILIIWEPTYVACGFTLYLNRRTALEAWDIELVFRRLRQRLSGITSDLLLDPGLLLLQLPNSAMAAASSCPLPVEDPMGPQAPRLLKQPLNSQAAQQSIAQQLDQPPFEHHESVTRWRFGEAADEPDEADAEALREWLERFFKLSEMWKSVETVALFFEVLLWAALFSLIAWLLWRYREWLRTFVGRINLPRPDKPAPPEQLFGLEVTPQSLPADIAGEVERLWDEQPRAALGLLYRALLSRMLHEQRLPLKSSHTEAEVMRLVQGLEQAQLSRFSQALTQHWQNLAYGHRLPPAALKQSLCSAWRKLFEQGVQA
jgi:hypothetical protein